MTPCIDCTLLTDRVVSVDGRAVARCGACGTEEAEPAAAEVALIPVPETAHFRTEPPGANGDELSESIRGYRRWCVLTGDCLDVMRRIPDGTVDAVVSDPPSGIAFMNAEWDKDKGGRDNWIAWLEERMREALRVCKPGAHALIWALPRTSHWTGMAIERAGWEVRDRVSHCFASGFPKSHNISKAIDRHNKDERPVHGTQTRKNAPSGLVGVGRDSVLVERKLTSAASAASAAWDGWGSALKPAVEDWWLARKPLAGTLAHNVLAHSTGGLNVDACRIAHASPDDFAAHKAMVDAIKVRGGSMEHSWKNSSDLSGANEVTALGRWPAHWALSHSAECIRVGHKVGVRPILGAVDGQPVKAAGFTRGSLAQVKRAEVAEVAEVYECVDGCPVKVMDEQSGLLPAGVAVRNRSGGRTFGGNEPKPPMRDMGYADAGGASRFFFTAKPSASEKEFGLEELDFAKVNDGRGTPIDNPYQRGETKRRNKHPTVKSLQLMRWLVRLITPPGGVVLDPFTGSGSTGVAVIREGARFVGAEQSEEFASFARARIARWENVRADLDEADAVKSANAAAKQATGSLSLFEK